MLKRISLWLCGGRAEEYLSERLRRVSVDRDDAWGAVDRLSVENAELRESRAAVQGALRELLAERDERQMGLVEAYG